MNVIEEYNKRLQTHSDDFFLLKKRYDLISLLRFITALVFIVSLVYIIINFNYITLFITVLSFIIFVLLMKYHDKISFKNKIKKALIFINENEINFLNNKSHEFDNGEKYLLKKHDYSFDLDLFGNKSLFHHLNRTATFIGEKSLSNILLKNLDEEDIVENQEAIKELKNKVTWRQKAYAVAAVANDSKETYNNLLNWLSKEKIQFPKLLVYISYLLPIVFFLSIGIYFFTGNSIFSKIAEYSFFIGIIGLSTQFSKLKKELGFLNQIEEIIKSYSLILKQIECEKFESEKLKDLQSKLIVEGKLPSELIERLEKLISKCSIVQNPIGAIFLNGISLYHVHTFQELFNWKNENKENFKTWLDVIGEIETLSSLANFSYNNPENVFPELNNESQFSFEALGHPLISPSERVVNNIDFINQKFVILTGSNMSGKSTFLRSLGINMVLAGIGSSICATKANINSMKLMVSMRLMDSLEENESYFFAEVKRLKEIIDNLKTQKMFVLLDEILRGTNSDDKRSGTIQVIKKIISKNAIGVIATHDLEVCYTADEFPNQLTNKCFEVEIIDNELNFDYKLREGVCKNKSATFLMEKMKII